MSVTVRIPTQLRNLSGNAAEVQVEASTVADALKDSPVADGQTISIVPAVAGG